MGHEWPRYTQGPQAAMSLAVKVLVPCHAMLLACRFGAATGLPTIPAIALAGLGILEDIGEVVVSCCQPDLGYVPSQGWECGVSDLGPGWANWQSHAQAFCSS